MFLRNRIDGFSASYPLNFGQHTNFSCHHRPGRVLDLVIIGRKAYICYDREFAATFDECFSELANMASDQFFVDLGQLSGDNGLTVADLSLKLVKRGLDSVRSLEENDGSAQGSNSIEPSFSVFRPSWRKAKE